MNQGSPLRALVIAPLAVGVLGFSGCTSARDTPVHSSGGRTHAATQSGSEPVPWKSIQVTPGQGLQPPLAGAPITLTLLADGAARQGQAFKFAVRIANTGDQPVAQQPCPAYRVQYLPHIETGMLNCNEAPSAIPPHAYVDFKMRVHVLTLGRPDIGGVCCTLLWQLGGERQRRSAGACTSSQHAGRRASNPLGPCRILEAHDGRRPGVT